MDPDLRDCYALTIRRLREVLDDWPDDAFLNSAYSRLTVILDEVRQGFKQANDEDP